MSLIHSRPELRELATMLDTTFDAISAFGVLASATSRFEQGDAPQLRETRVNKFLAWLTPFKGIIEQTLKGNDFKFGTAHFPYCYNTQRWRIDSAPSGYTDENDPPAPCDVLISIIGTWVMTLRSSSDDQPGSALPRLLRSSLWQCLTRGFEESLAYLVALHRAGFVLVEQDLFQICSLMIDARSRVNSDSMLVAQFISSSALDEPSSFLLADLDFGQYAVDHKDPQQVVNPDVLEWAFFSLVALATKEVAKGSRRV